MAGQSNSDFGVDVKEEVVGSNPTIGSRLAHNEGREAQLVECRTLNLKVAGSKPASPKILLQKVGAVVSLGSVVFRER